MALSDRVKERMRQHVHAAQQQMLGGGADFPKWNLTGKNAIVKPAEAVLGRVLPRWDIGQKYQRQGDQWVVNPAYEDDLIFFPAGEHWWDDASGKPSQAWCPKTFDEATPCPVCEASEELMRSGNAEDRGVGKRIAARRTYLYNFVVGRSGKRQLTEAGRPDIRVLPAQNTIFVAISNFMTGGASSDEDARSAFARGDISDPKDGYDIMLTRPSGAQGERWKVDCAPQPSPLYTAAEAPAWDGWMERLVDLPAVVQAAIKPYDVLYEAYYGEPPAPAAEAPAGPDAGPFFSPAGSVVLPAPQVSTSSDPWGAHAPAAPAALVADPGLQQTATPGAPPFDLPKRAPAPRRPSGRK